MKRQAETKLHEEKKHISPKRERRKIKSNRVAYLYKCNVNVHRDFDAEEWKWTYKQ